MIALAEHFVVEALATVDGGWHTPSLEKEAGLRNPTSKYLNYPFNAQRGKHTC